MIQTKNVTLAALVCFLLALFCAYGADLFPSGGISIDFSQCQYSKAIGDSERLDADSFSQVRNSRFSEAGQFWEGKGVKFSKGEALLESGSELKTSGAIAELSQNTHFEAQIDVQGTGALEVTLGSLDSGKQPTRPEKRMTFELNGEKQCLKYKILAFPKTTELTIALRQLSGKARVTRADILSMESLKWVSVRCMPAAITDNVFCVMENNPIPMSFQYKTARPGKENIPKSMDLILKYPDGFTLWPGYGIAKVSDTLEDGVRTARFRFRANAIPGQYLAHHTCNVLAGCSLKASDRLYPMSYHLEYSGVRTEPYAMNLKVIPGFKGNTPKLFNTGLRSANEILFAKGKGMEELADTIKNLGFNQIHHNTHENARDLSDVLQSKGIGTTVWDYFFINGYILGFNQAAMPDDVKFIGKDGKPIRFNSWHCYMCPVAAYTRSEFFNKNFLEYLGEKSKKYNFGTFFSQNWEPFEFDDKGCFCERCREEFVRYSGLPRETVLKAWPNEMTGKYRKTWVKFRSWQHAKLVEAILDGMRELSQKYKREFVFCPGIGVGDVFGFSSFYEQYTVRDYIDKLDWLEPWGPYIFHNASKPYTYNIAVNYGVYRTGRMVKEEIKKLCAKGKTPKLEALPHGYQCTTWVTEPEATAYETASYFLNRYESSHLYKICGLDGRYWRALGELNNAISYVEQFVAQGEKLNNVTMTLASPCPYPMAMYDANNPTLARHAEEMRRELPVTVDAFKLNGSVMLALGNAWQRGEAFAKVSVPGLAKGVKYAVYIPDRKVTLSKDYTAEELANGVLLHVRAFGFCFYVVEPTEASKDYGTVAGRDALSRLLADRLPSIRTKYSEDRAYAADFVHVTTYDFGQAPALNAGNVAVKPKRNLSDSILLVKTPYYACDLDMGNGGGVTNFTVKGKTLVDDKSAMLRDGFVSPSLLLNRAYNFVAWEATEAGAAVTLKYKLGAKDVAALKGLSVVKRYVFGEKSITLHTELKNEGKTPIVFSYRSHNVPSLFTKEGSLTFEGGEKLTRSGSELFHQAPGYTSTCYGAKAGVECRASSAVFQGNGGILKLGWKIPNFIGVYRWDAPKSVVSSFEIASGFITLQAGQKIQFEFRMQ